MAKKFFTDESLATLVDEAKTYADTAASNAAATVANRNRFHYFVANDVLIAPDIKDDHLNFESGTGISLDGDKDHNKITITNSGVISVMTGIANGTISVNTNGTVSDVAVKGLGSAAYTNSSAYATAGHTHTVAKITDLTATATELNYMDGVTSNVQTQLDGKVPTSRTINGKALSSNITLTASDVSAYTKTEIDNMEFITVEDIDIICSGAVVTNAEGVAF